ncbi:MAG: 30S ribosomal protein S4 [Patescibacteria group bacterium]|jgi:small subunit ribosomal protein S4|nr:30S ribosomal protein S4 [Patescibacteria group bacterium]
MASTQTSVCKLCRREGTKLFLKGARCATSKCAVARRPFPPGVHGPERGSRMTDYGKQLREKQKAKRLYGLSETQFSNYFKASVKMKGDSGVNLVRSLESRLDNAIYRAGFAKSRAAARQIVSHSQVQVNNHKVNIPSFRVKQGDVITVQERKKSKSTWKNLSEEIKSYVAPSWLTVDAANLTFKVTGEPMGEELKQIFEPKLIIEYYSR